LSTSRGLAGAPASCPSASSPARRMPHGSTAKNTIHQMMTNMTMEDVQVTASRLLDLHERPAEILGVQEQHRLLVRADLGLAVAEHARALGLELVAGGQDVVHLEAHMVHAAGGMIGQELGDR